MKKQVFRTMSWVAVAAIFALPLMSLPGAVEMFLKIDDIKGEAQNKNHKDEIDVLAWNWGMTQSGTTHVGAGGGAGKVNVQDLVVTKWIDKASPHLMLRCANGKRIPEAKLTVTKTFKDSVVDDYFVITLKDVLVKGVETGMNATDTGMTEKVKLNFAWFQIEYNVLRTDGSSEGKTQMEWSVLENTGG
jgi:type VI secretion system secreted protein Hcp